ncbi:DUF4396 domain-containing protein [Phytomonospora endophytica]|uniref:DUF4396 domain-containing protein n=1 Tax=Phytomonospora endophytica TaxID=714109 RepID=A0A841FD14_9ACTN|nr:DUF4396 domain-containing protein [Phytomonospora endophytica]MBB6033315.1 hypothetical protein [Phytomonospora endophytica]GIG65542.1 hypothetical protein Pen01_18370 [Phytomonospora endophytica]
MGHGSEAHRQHHGHHGHHAPHDHHGPGGTHAGHEEHAGHGAHDAHAGHGGGRVSWKTAAQATLHCLTGCAIGEVLGMIIGTALGWGNAATIVLAVALAFLFGYALTMWGIRKSGLTLKRMIGVALAADTVSIVFMEIIDNSAMMLIPGAMDAGLGSWLFWISLAGALALAFVVTTPINKWIIGRGKGHAVVHQYHH